VVALLLDVISSVPGAHYHCHPLGVIVSELFSNALDHGVLGLASGIKDGESGFERYCEARAAALARLEQGSIVVRIESRCSKGLRTLELQFRDSGSGFKAPPGSAATGLQRHGRGIDVVRALCSNVEYHGPGNDVRVTYALNDVPDELLRAVA
jgi:two-component sensor histidine kinase